jgi:hypothetical protein
MRVIGVLIPQDAWVPHLRAAFVQGLAQEGYVEGKNLRLDVRRLCRCEHQDRRTVDVKSSSRTSIQGAAGVKPSCGKSTNVLSIQFAGSPLCARKPSTLTQSKATERTRDRARSPSGVAECEVSPKIANGPNHLFDSMGVGEKFRRRQFLDLSILYRAATLKSSSCAVGNCRRG